MHVIDLRAMCYRIEAVLHVIDVMVMVMEVMDIVIKSKLY